jgi:hypothetical protein
MLWNIAVVDKRNTDDVKWYVNGYDGRPLRFTDYRVAERHVMHMNNGNSGAIFLEDDLTYVVKQEGGAWYDSEE